MRYLHSTVLLISILGSALATLPSHAIQGSALESNSSTIAPSTSLTWAEEPLDSLSPQPNPLPAAHLISRRYTGSPSQMRDTALALVNQDRYRQGLSQLGHNPLLDRVAQAHAEDMIRRGYFSHYTPEGQDPTGRVRQAGGGMGAGENIMNFMPRGNSYSQSSLISEFQRQFMVSPRHRANILRADYQSFGYGFATTPDGSRVVAVQLFGLSQR